MTKDITVRKGRCHCGAICFQTDAAPNLVEHCHCSSCRRFNGSAISTMAGFDRDRVHITHGSPVYYESTPGTRRSFCGRCGTRLFWESDHHYHEVYINIGAFEDPASLEAHCHMWVSEKLPWFEINDVLPQYTGFVKDE